MNFAERLAGLYLRLNGFFLMPAFSTFTVRAREEDRKAHAHVALAETVEMMANVKR